MGSHHEDGESPTFQGELCGLASGLRIARLKWVDGKRIVDTLADRVREYCKALSTPWTYALHRNPYAMAGFLWGLPVPVVSVVLVQWAAGGPLSWDGCCRRLFTHPVFLVFAIHPFLFAVLFGAFGTIRENQSRRIRGLIRHLEGRAETDGLTGLYNQRYFHEALPRWVAEASQSREPLALALIDLDGLKPINDTHGHAQGDLVLRQIGLLIGEYARATDLAARTGGDEFAMIMRNTTASQAAAIAERLRERIASTPCTLAEGKGSLPISISIGVVSMPETGNTSMALLKAGDQALYRAKTEGRNRVRLG